MNITDLLNEKCVILSSSCTERNEALRALCDALFEADCISDKEAVLQNVLQREKESSTFVGSGASVPHCKASCVKKSSVAAMTLTKPIVWDSEGNTTDVVFLLATPEANDDAHVELLSSVSLLLLNENFLADIRNAKTVQSFFRVLKNVSKNEQTETSYNAQFPDILCVTSCPTGIAHTYMAEESLKKAAEKKNLSIKIETRGQAGTKNELTSEEIKNAKGIILACDVSVPMDRFSGKRVVQCSVSDGIRKADSLLDKIIFEQVPPYKSSGGNSQSNKYGNGTYAHLMTGVSHMLPFVVGGGILIALAFLFDSLAYDLNSLPLEMKSQFGTLTPLANFLKAKAGGLAFGFMLPILAGYIAFSIADRPGLAVGFLGGAIAANGTSGFLGALVAGFFAGYTVLFLKKLFSKIPQSLDGIKPVLLYPLFGMLLVALGMNFIIEPIVGYINGALNTALNNMVGVSGVVLGLLLGGMMAVDMGGPVNKASYVFATGMLAEGHYAIMASVMIGGMTPPIGIALATIFFKNKFTEEERKAGSVNFIMGLSFITEGAIPFAARDPAKVLPSCIIGSAVAGALSNLFGCTLMAPHGGVFVFPVVGHPLLYIVSLLIGSIVTCALLGLLKKPITEQ